MARGNRKFVDGSFQPTFPTAMQWMKILGVSKKYFWEWGEHTTELAYTKELVFALMHVAASVGDFEIHFWTIQGRATNEIKVPDDEREEWQAVVLKVLLNWTTTQRKALVTAYQLGGYQAAEPFILPLLDEAMQQCDKERIRTRRRRNP